MNILVVENDMLVAMQLKRCLGTTDVKADLHHVRDGFGALDFLDKKNSFEEAPNIDLVILNAHTPNLNGYQVMAKMESRDNLKKIPVLLMTHELNSNSILRNCKLHNPPPPNIKGGHRDFFVVTQMVKSFLIDSLAGQAMRKLPVKKTEDSGE